VYRWEGKVEREEEILLVIKTWGRAYEDVEETIRELHSYELPECISLRVEKGSEQYLEWVENSVRLGDE
jgi:periplasmic divalent cation tolerance protein